MMRFARFLVGLSMVVVGVALAAPMVSRLVDLVLTGPAGGADAGPAATAPGAAAWAGAPDGPQAAVAPGGAGAYCIPDPLRSGPAAGPVPGQWPSPPPAALVPETDPPQLSAAGTGTWDGERSPPSPPSPLPGPPADLTLAPPAFPSTYRSTLDVPPPPLLDVDAPSPLVMPSLPGDGQAAATVAAVAEGAGSIRATPATYVASSTAAPRGLDAGSAGVAASDRHEANGAPAAWIVRDGDDLTNIATRLYGHPGAAESIWNANRDRITDPAVLPIGASLRVPLSWTPPAARPTGVAAVLEPARRPGSVRVGPGETLESLALRFYGDKAWSERLWEANRDRLRNPALVVPGMELRLP